MFQPGSRLIRFLTAVCDLMILNILLVLSCVTVVFSGDGVVSLYTVTLRMFRGTEDSPGKSFLRALRGNFIPSVPSTLLLLADVTMIAVLRRVLYAETLLLSPTVFVLLTIITIFLTALLSYLFPLTARFNNTFVRHLGNAARLAVANLPVTFLITGVNLFPVILPLLLPQLLGIVAAFWLVAGFSVGAWMNSFYLNRIFSRME
ncbi:MAG: DUF624 domain-containing protein [Oscillospiraceae bacterium]|nr:DUF624 domain-containing protein [Oscillospiraceae bacterium]